MVRNNIMTTNAVHILHYGGNGFRESFRLIIRGLFPIVLILTGVSLLYLRIPGWSFIFGLPITIIGVAFLIYAYDEAVSGTISYPSDKDIIDCNVCDKPTKMIPGVGKDETVCPKCEEKGN